MTTNSLAFRLFATAVAWTLLALPIAGAIIYSLYAPGGRDQLRPAPQPAAHRRPQRHHRSRRPGARRAQGRGRAAVRGHALRLVLADQAARRQAGPRSSARARSPACPSRCPASTTSSPTSARCAGPTWTARSSSGCASPRPSTCSARARWRSATRWPSPARWARWRRASRNFRTRLTLALSLAGVGLLAAHPVPGALRPASRWPRWRRAWPPSARARPPGSTSACRRRSSRCSRSSTRSSNPTRTSSSGRAPTSATSRMP